MNSETACVGVPVRNRARAIAFYSALLGIDFDRDGAAPVEFQEGVAAAGLIHLRIACLDAALESVWANGGRVLEPERLDEEPVERILVLDSEGNRLALSVA
jgi:predicted enzyme related to lactoylglutathione lyase